jgi:DNA-directed RNA polymerase
MKRSFMPNFIHSLDAANVHLLLLKQIWKNLVPFIRFMTVLQVALIIWVS